MSDIAIRVERLTKEYRLGVINHGTLHKDLQSWWARLCGKEDPNSLISVGHHSSLLKGNPHMLALNDVSFDVKQGEILGIIGRNGAGKSTLLKVLSRVTAPSSGTVKIKGRVASLLEVGTGFHPELTGRENIYLNGAILGMSKKEIKEKFDEIVAFAEIEKFIDTPVKRYSSGMYVRLAFAVAAHLEPEILVVDEVLAVGDLAFQTKCLGKMGEVAMGGRTVLFVSHNMAIMEKLCERVILLKEGRIINEGVSRDVVNSYVKLAYDQSKVNKSISEVPRSRQDFGVRIKLQKCWMISSDGNETEVYKQGDKLIVGIELLSLDNDYDDLHLNIGINTMNNVRVATVTTRTNYGFFSCPKEKRIVIRARLNNVKLLPGLYNLSLVVGRRGRPLDIVNDVNPFNVIDAFSSQVVDHPHLSGIIQANAEWEFTELS